MAVGKYVLAISLIRDEADSGYYVVYSSNASYFGNETYHIADSSGLVYIDGSDLVINAKGIVSGLTNVNQTACTAIALTIS